MEIMDNYKLRVDDIIKNYYGIFSNNPNIVGVGRGNKIINGNITDVPSLTIFVKEKRDINFINSYNIIPKVVKGALTDVYQTGELMLRAGEQRPALGGISIGENSTKTSGTLGYAVTDKKKQSLYILSCAHVLAESNKVDSPPQKILQPSLQNGGKYRQSFIGVVDKIIPLKYSKEKSKLVSDANEVDAGIALVGPYNLKTQSETLEAYLANKVAVTGTIKVKAKDKVWKLGATTGMTEGQVITVNSTLNGYDKIEDKYFSYINQIVTDIKSKPGDSGSLGVTQSGNKAFGLLTSGNEKICVFSDIDRIMELLNVELAQPLIK